MSTLFDELKSDHDRHRDLLAQIDAGGAGRAELFEVFRLDVTSHAAAEEQTLYASMMADPKLQDEARHSVAEHKEVDDLLTELFALDVADPEWGEKFAHMRHRYEHHIEEEEEEMFPAAEEQIPGDLQPRLAERFEERKVAELAKAEATDPLDKEHKD